MGKMESVLEGRAVRAWRALAGAGAVPDRVELVRALRNKTVIFRLIFDGKPLGSVIARRSHAGSAELERSVYGLLGDLPVTSLRCHGVVEDPHDPRYAWLFLEDARARGLRSESQGDRRLAASWLAALHASARDLAALSHLPSKDGEWHLAQLSEARQRLTDHLKDPDIDGEGRRLLRTVVSQLEILEMGWKNVRLALRAMPTTLVHGDFKPENIFIRRGETSPLVLPCDWEMAGHGPIAIDLEAWTPGIDLEVYASAVRATWPEVDFEAVSRFAKVGKLLRLIDSINWASTGLKHKSKFEPMNLLRYYNDQLFSQRPNVL